MVRGLVRFALVAAAAALVGVPAAFAGSGMKVGAVEDAAKWSSAPGAKMSLAKNAGFDSVRMTAQWSSGQTAPSSGELVNLQNAATAARNAGIEPIVAIYNVGSSSTPADPVSRDQFVQYAVAVAKGLPQVSRFVVGNEPNSNYYWMPQFNSDGSDAAAPAYEALLAQAYDAIKAARPTATVIGGALDPRGGDVAGSTKPTHSPTSFIKDLGGAYRSSGRVTPLMDVFDMHVYQDYSALPPSFTHPNSTTIAISDYGKLVSLLGQAFDGTAQKGSSVPIVYGEFGVESVIPSTKAAVYTGTEPTSTHPVDEQTQAAYYSEAMKLALCQPNVIGLMIFHVSDESDLAAWQSGPYYADDTAKSSLSSIRTAANATRAGTITTCPDASAPTVTLSAPSGTIRGTITLGATASDNVGVGHVDFLVNGAVVATKAVPPYTVSWASKPDGPVTIQARAYDAVGNAGSSATVSALVDNYVPDTTITKAPPATTNQTTATVSFKASETDVTFACSLDGATYAACTSPVSYTGLAQGQHTLSVRATDAAGNVDATPAAATWTVDTTAPDTSITSGPTGTVTDTTASFAFGATESSTFQCQLDAAAWAACVSPVTYSGLAVGSHTFQVRATDAAGNVDPTPATQTWTIAAVATSSPPPNLVANGSFESGLTGWTSWQATLSLAYDALDGTQAAKVSSASGATSYSIYPSTRPVQQTTAATRYVAGGAVRSDDPGHQVCLYVREWSSSSTQVATVQTCLTTTSAWQRFAPLSYTTQQSGGSLQVFVQVDGGGTSFETDALTLTRS